MHLHLSSAVGPSKLLPPSQVMHFVASAASQSVQPRLSGTQGIVSVLMKRQNMINAEVRVDVFINVYLCKI
jgi:hypothetical protein